MTHSYKPLDAACDRELERRVRLFLIGRGYPALRLVSVDVTNGVVALRGKTSSFHIRQMAVECAKRVAGVRQIVDNLRVDADEMRTSDPQTRLLQHDFDNPPAHRDNPQDSPQRPLGDTVLSRVKLIPSLS